MAHMAALSRNIFFSEQNTPGIYSGPDPKSPAMAECRSVGAAQPGYSLLAAAVPCSGNPFLRSLRNIDHNPQIVVSGQIRKGYRITEIMNGSDRFTRGRLAKPGSPSDGTSNDAQHRNTRHRKRSEVPTGCVQNWLSFNVLGFLGFGCVLNQVWAGKTRQIPPWH